MSRRQIEVQPVLTPAQRMDGIRCDCGSNTAVYRTKRSSGIVVRYRKCRACAATFTTIEKKKF